MYFDRLELEPDDAMAAEATQLADEAIEAARAEGVTLSRTDLPALATMLDRLATRQLGAEIDDKDVTHLARLYGSLLGEIVRARADGSWGIGLQFDDQLPFGGLLIGYIKFWPCHEAGDRIAGRVSMPLVERIERLCARAAANGDDDDDPERLYPLQAGEGYFDVGVTSDGRLALIAAFSHGTTVIFFSADGTCLRSEERPNATQRSNQEVLRVLQAKLGFVPQAIRVKRFLICDSSIGIENLPNSYQDLQDDPDSEYDAEVRAERLAAIDKWTDEGRFVIYCGNELWLDGEGHVTSS